jgi:hypothetical protein
MLDEIEKKVDKAQIHMDNVNVKMKQALDGVSISSLLTFIQYHPLGHEGR